MSFISLLLFLLWPLFVSSFVIREGDEVDEMSGNKLGGSSSINSIEDKLPEHVLRMPQDAKFITETDVWIDSMNPLNPDDFDRAKSLSPQDLGPLNHDANLNSPLYFEGDIFGPLVSNTSEQKNTTDTKSSSRRQKSLISFVLDWILQKGRNAIKDMTAKWPEARIPYVLSRRFSDHDRSVLAAAIQTYNDKTCIRFVPKNTTDNDFVYIYPGMGCASQVGRGGGMQYVSLGVGCLYVGISQHELMHVTGFWHEQSRADRDDYVRIIWENIEPGMEYNFDKYTWNDIQSLEEPYDYGSVMHYGTHAFAKGFGPTILPKDGSSQIMGQRVGLSDVDLEKINKLYGCTQYLKKNKAFSTLESNKIWISHAG